MEIEEVLLALRARLANSREVLRTHVYLDRSRQARVEGKVEGLEIAMSFIDDAVVEVLNAD